MASTFSSAPPANTIGKWRVVLLCRNATATSRPYEGSRSRSITTPAGILARNCPITPPVLSGEASTRSPGLFSRRARSLASSGFQHTRRTSGIRTGYQSRIGILGLFLTGGLILARSNRHHRRQRAVFHARLLGPGGSQH